MRGLAKQREFNPIRLPRSGHNPYHQCHYFQQHVPGGCDLGNYLIYPNVEAARDVGERIACGREGAGRRAGRSCGEGA